MFVKLCYFCLSIAYIARWHHSYIVYWLIYLWLVHPILTALATLPKYWLAMHPVWHCQNAALSMSLYSECTFIACYVALIISINHGFMLFSFRKKRISLNPSTSQLKICSVKQLKYHRTSMLWMNDSANETKLQCMWSRLNKGTWMSLLLNVSSSLSNGMTVFFHHLLKYKRKRMNAAYCALCATN